MSSNQQSVFDHLNEVRTRLIVSLIYFIVVFVLSFIWVEDVYKFITKDLDTKLAVLGPSDILWAYFIIAGAIALVATVPLLIYQIWAFVKPGLYEHEQKLARLYIPGMFLLFICGFLFGYVVILPIVFNFVTSLGEDLFTQMFTLHKYISFVIGITLPFAFLFLLPLFIMFLTTINIINPIFLTKYRKYAYFALVVTAIVISPPDFISDFIVAVPLLLLYEISVICSKVIYRKKTKEITDETSA